MSDASDSRAGEIRPLPTTTLFRLDGRVSEATVGWPEGHD